MPASFYRPTGAEGSFAATSATIGPWDTKLQHGSPPATLLMRAIEKAYSRDDVRVARVTFDFFGPVPVDEVHVTAEQVRPGARVELTRARLSAGGRTAMEASAWRIALQRGGVPLVADARPAPRVPPPGGEVFEQLPSFGYGQALEWRFVEGSFFELGPAAIYTRARLPLIEGEPLSPLQRVLLMVDSANGISSAISFIEYTFVPVALDVCVRRYPRTEWVGMRAETRIESDGIGHTTAELFDEGGYLGTATQTLFVGPRR
ncbi:MAG TPA: thioesterase family protein [Polyangiaceae bacterium]|nr:thioesterase family protein [Polyangiaceae bacterium]